LNSNFILEEPLAGKLFMPARTGHLTHAQIFLGGFSRKMRQAKI
jgi:hypothetical protein